MTVKRFVSGMYCKRPDKAEDIVVVIHKSAVEFEGDLEGLAIDEPLWFMNAEVDSIVMMKRGPFDNYNITIYL